MRAYRLIVGAWVSGTLFALAASPGNSLDNPDNVAASLRQIARDLNDSVKLFQKHLDQEIALHDSGYHPKAGRRIPAADADLTGSAADLVQVTKRKLFAGRMISARRPGYEPTPLEDADHIQLLIAEARARLKTGNKTLRRLFVVSAKELNPRTEAEQRAELHELQVARNAALEAAKRAFVALPIPLPDADSPEEQRENVWDLMVANQTLQHEHDGASRARTPQQTLLPEGGSFPIRFEEGKRITLVNEHFCRVTLTDSGIEDTQARHLFYQEEWVARQGSLARTAGTGPGGVIIYRRWAVAVNTRSGQHTLLRRYEPREFRGTLDELYQLQWSDHVSNAELAERPVAPSLQEMAPAVESLSSTRDEMRRAFLEYRRQVRESMNRNDALLAEHENSALDEELPYTLRENLFAVRCHLANVTAILEAENEVRHAAARAAARVQTLEALVAWVNGNALERETPAQDPRSLLQQLNRSDREIESTRALEREVLAALPPDLSAPELQFPALMKDVILRIRRLGGTDDPAGILRCSQELWRRTGSTRSEGQVKRTIVPIDIESKTGRQIPVHKEVKYYRLDVGETLEQIYDENSAQ